MKLYADRSSFIDRPFGCPLDDVDRAIEEFRQAIDPLFAGRRRQIELLKSRIIEKTRRHQNASNLQRLLIAAVTEQLQMETAA